MSKDWTKPTSLSVRRDDDSDQNVESRILSMGNLPSRWSLIGENLHLFQRNKKSSIIIEFSPMNIRKKYDSINVKLGQVSIFCHVRRKKSLSDQIYCVKMHRFCWEAFPFDCMYNGAGKFKSELKTPIFKVFLIIIYVLVLLMKSV